MAMAEAPSSLLSFFFLLLTSLSSLQLMQSSAAFRLEPMIPKLHEVHYRAPCGYYLYPKLGSLVINETITVVATAPVAADLRSGYEEVRANRCLILERTHSAFIKGYFRRSKGANTRLAEAAALTNCLALSQLSIRHLEEVSGEYKAAEQTEYVIQQNEYFWWIPRTQLSEEAAARTRSLMSRVAANQQSCFDRLAEAKFGSLEAALRIVKDEL